MKTAILFSMTLILALSAGAQDVPKVEVPVGFSFINVHPDLDPITSFNLFGGGGQFDVNFGNVFGIKADLFGYTQSTGLRNQLESHGLAGAASGNLFTYMFGPQIKKHTGVFQPFGEVLVGAAHTNAYATILTDEGKILNGSRDNNAFAFAAGGGIDLAVSKHIALRPVEVDYLLTRFGAGNYHGNQNNFRYVGGLDFMFGGAPPVPVSASCSASPSEVYPGDPVTATMNVQNFNPKHTVAYSWSGAGGKLSSTSTTATIDTTGLTPGTYAAIGTATDPKEGKNNKATCSANFTVKARPMNPPQASCSASPSTVKPGDPATFTVSASSPDNVPLTYAWSANAGSITGNGTTASLDTTNAPQGAPVTATATVTDSRGLSTSCTASVNVLAPPVVVNEVTEIGECKFVDAKRPARVDNVCKAVLDDVALRVQREPNGKFVVVGYSEDEETIKVTQVGAQRAVNVKYYMVNGEGGSQIDATRLELRTSGTVKEKGTKIYFVPSGATFSEESVVVDETQVQGQSRNAPAKRKGKKATTAPPAAAQ